MLSSGVLPALLLSTAAGLSTTIGSLITMFSGRKNTKFMSIALGFSAGVMITVSFAELLPEAEKNIVKANPRYGYAAALCFLVAGVAVAAIIDMLIPSDFGKPGAGSGTDGTVAGTSSLLHMGVVTAIAITIHNFPEGIATFMAGYSDIKIGLPVAISIAMHNIPEGIAVAAPIYFATGSRKKAFLYSALSGLSEPLGAVAAFLCLSPFLNSFSLGGIFAAVAGIMVYIAFGELVPASERYRRPRAAVTGIIFGILFMLFILTVSLC